MAQLLYKTRADAPPQGKPRVYFACHPLDFRPFFSEISGEILSCSNCAVYYSDGEWVEEEDFYMQLDQMQLIVMPITSRLLYTSNSALDVVLPYAEKNHIPILPLMQERNLEQSFNEKFGNLQFLDKHNKDSTALSYDEKLKKYLESVLVGDELAQKVREAFDAYIFLSYRKKDRKYAQELMRLIHRSAFCRDIAIWYDEFLTPGENFNGAIRAALEKSSLFVLTVTPNLVNEENYVMTTEYPAAQEAGKPVLAAELVETDQEALKRNYLNIPDCVDPRDLSALDASLIERLRQLAVRENDQDPQHNFFIGLAYLSGIDVEVDYERAVKLIAGAAEAGLTEAMEKLAGMYQRGEGVKRDYPAANAWFEKLAEQARLEYESGKTKEAADCYFDRLWDLGNARNDLGEIHAARMTYEKMYSLACGWAQRDHYDGVRRKLAVCCLELGWICFVEMDHPAAKEWYLKALDGAGKLPESDESKRLSGLCYERLGDLCIAAQDPRGAREWYGQSLQITRERVQSGAEGATWELAMGYDKMGRACDEAGDLTGARSWYLQFCEVSEKLAQFGTEPAQRLLSVSYERLGVVCQAEGKLEEAARWYTKGVRIDEKLAQSGTVQAMMDLAIDYQRLGNNCVAFGRLDDAKRWLTKFSQTMQKLEPIGAAFYRNLYAISLERLGYVSFLEGNTGEAKRWLTKSVDIRKALEHTGAENVLSGLCACYQMLGDVCKQGQDLQAAKNWFTKCLEIAKRKVTSGSADSLRMYSIACNRMGGICEAEWRQGKSQGWFSRMLRSDTQARFTEAKYWYTQSIEAGRKLVEKTGTPESYDDLALVYYYLGNLTQDRTLLVKAHEIYARLAKESPAVARFVQLESLTERAVQQLRK